MQQRLSRTGYLSLREAAEWLGMGKDRRARDTLRERLRAIETRTGKLILRLGCRGRFEVTKAQLREHFPEHFSRREATLATVAHRFAALMASIGRIKRAEWQLSQEVRKLTERVEFCERRLGTDRNENGGRSI